MKPLDTHGKAAKPLNPPTSTLQLQTTSNSNHIVPTPTFSKMRGGAAAFRCENPRPSRAKKLSQKGHHHLRQAARFHPRQFSARIRRCARCLRATMKFVGRSSRSDSSGRPPPSSIRSGRFRTSEPTIPAAMAARRSTGFFGPSLRTCHALPAIVWNLPGRANACPRRSCGKPFPPPGRKARRLSVLRLRALLYEPLGEWGAAHGLVLRLSVTPTGCAGRSASWCCGRATVSSRSVSGEPESHIGFGDHLAPSRPCRAPPLCARRGALRFIFTLTRLLQRLSGRPPRLGEGANSQGIRSISSVGPASR